MHKITRLALSLALPLAFAARTRAEDGVVEIWDRMHMAGAPAGWVHTTVRRTAGEKPEVESVMDSFLSMKRLGQATEVRRSMEVRED